MSFTKWVVEKQEKALAAQAKLKAKQDAAQAKLKAKQDAAQAKWDESIAPLRSAKAAKDEAMAPLRAARAAKQAAREQAAREQAEREAAAKAEAARREAAARAERIAQLTGSDGKIRTENAVWDGRTLVLQGRSVFEVRRNARMSGTTRTWDARFSNTKSYSTHKMSDVTRPLKRGETVIVPAEQIAGVQIASIANDRGVVQVFTLDGRQYRFGAPAGLTDALMMAQGEGAMDAQPALTH